MTNNRNHNSPMRDKVDLAVVEQFAYDGKTHKELADELGVHAPTLTALLSGQRYPEYREVWRNGKARRKAAGLKRRGFRTSLAVGKLDPKIVEQLAFEGKTLKEAAELLDVTQHIANCYLYGQRYPEISAAWKAGKTRRTGYVQHFSSDQDQTLIAEPASSNGHAAPAPALELPEPIPEEVFEPDAGTLEVDWCQLGTGLPRHSKTLTLSTGDTITIESDANFFELNSDERAFFSYLAVNFEARDKEKEKI